MMLTPEQDNPDYKLLYQSLMKQKAELVEQHRLLGNHVKQQNLRIAELEKDAARYRWIDPNDRTQKQYLPWIGEAVLFCHGGVTYYGQHTGGSFQTGRGVTARNFNTWECRWMYPPAAMQPTWPEDTSDYGSRIAVIGQNGATGEHYEEEIKE